MHHRRCFSCSEKQFTAQSRIFYLLNVFARTTINGSETQKRMGVHQKGFTITSWSLWQHGCILDTPVWVSYKQKQREPIIRSRRLQGWVPQAQSEPVWEVLLLTGEVQRKHAISQALPSSPLFNLITVMSLETVGCTTSNVDVDKHTALTDSHWQLNAKRIVMLRPLATVGGPLVSKC